MCDLTFTRVSATRLHCDQYPSFYVWLPCDKRTYSVVYLDDAGREHVIKRGIRTKNGVCRAIARSAENLEK